MQVLFDKVQYDHEPRFFIVNGTEQKNPEVAERARKLLHSLREKGYVIKKPHGLEQVATGHSPGYLNY